jgi:hypothetical protein
VVKVPVEIRIVAIIICGWIIYYALTQLIREVRGPLVRDIQTAGAKTALLLDTAASRAAAAMIAEAVKVSAEGGLNASQATSVVKTTTTAQTTPIRRSSSGSGVSGRSE